MKLAGERINRLTQQRHHGLTFASVARCLRSGINQYKKSTIELEVRTTHLEKH